MNPKNLRSFLLLLVAILFGVATGHAATVTLSNLNQTYNGNPRPVTVAKTPGNLSVTVTYQGSGGTVYPNSTTAPTNAGNYIVTASYLDDGDPENTIEVLIVSKASQTVTFPAIGAKTTLSAPFALGATASSSLPVTYSVVSGNALVSISSGNVTVLGAGDVTIRAAQAGNNNYNAASNVDRSFTISATPQVITFPEIANVGTGSDPITLEATATSGLPVTYSILSGEEFVSHTNGVLTILGAGTVTVRASQAGDDTYAAASPVDRTFNILATEQTITFEPIANYDADARPIPLVATASSGLPVVFTVSGPAVIVDGDNVDPTGEGVVTVTASQPGDDTFDAATPVERTFTVGPGKKRILAIGDSFTQGGAGNLGYREAFLRILQGDKINGSNPFGFDYTPFVDMIGTMSTTLGGNPANSDYPNTFGRDPDHEGHFGWSTGDILNGNPDEPAAGKLSDWLESYTYLPTIVLLHIGTVDAHFVWLDGGEKKLFAQTTRDNISGIIDTLRAANPNCQVFLAKVPPGGYFSGSHGDTIYDWATAINTLNALIDRLAADKNAESVASGGSNYVYTVDNYTGFDPATMLTDDNLHPNTTGESFIASNMFDAIQWSLNGLSNPPAPAAYTGAPRILTLGDSITQGGGGYIGYRDALMRLLAGENIAGANPTNRVLNANFIGTMNTTYNWNPFIPDYPALVNAQPQHEGHGAWEAQHILNGWPEDNAAPWGTGTGKLSDWLLGYTPDIVLLHIGTNDAYNNFDDPTFVTATRNSIGGILNTLKGANPNVVIFLAKIVPGAAWFNDQVNAVNAQLDSLAADLNAGHFQPFIYVVDQNTGFDVATMLHDDLHPNDVGAERMAVKWYQAIASYLAGNGLIPEINSATTASGELGQPFSYAITATSAPSTFNATGLPSGLTVNSSTGVISGEPATTGTFPVTITASNAAGSDSATLTITVTKATAPVVLSALSHVYDGTGKAAIATTTPAGLNVTFTYDGGITLPVAVGSYAVVATVSDSNYIGSASGTLVITKAPATIALSNLSRTYTGLPLTPSATTTPAGLDVVYTFGGSSEAPTAPGSYPVTATIDDANYSGTINGTLVISKADQTITFPALQSITRDINFVILSATSSSGLPISYSIVSGPASLTASVLTPTGTGNVVIRATQPGDGNFNAATPVERTLSIVEANATVSITNLQFTYDGAPKTPTVTTTPGNLPVDITYSGSASAPVNAGSYSVLAAVNNGTYAGSASATLVISKASATVNVSALVHKFDGAAKSVTVTTVPAGLPLTVTYNGSTTAPSAKGTYEVVATVNHENYSGSSTATLSIGAGAQLVNLSSRALVGAGGDIMIPGFVVGGTGTKNLLIRGIGPALAGFGLEGVLETPTLKLLSGSTVIASNTGWSTAPNAAEIVTRSAEVGAFALPADSGDCALLLGVAPGSYTVQLSGVNNTTGIGLVEIYDLDDTGSSARLVNISTRTQVGTGGNILIPGYVIDGDVPRTLLIRAVGPTLGEVFGVGGVLADPTLTVFKGNQEIATNDNWGTNANVAEIISTTATVGAFELLSGSNDAVVLVTLNPGAYTVQVSGVGATTGVSLVEVYEIEE